MEIRFNGKIESIGMDKTADGKIEVQKLYFRRDYEKGGFDSVVVTDYEKNVCKVGDQISCEVYLKPWVSRRGSAGVSIVALKGKFEVVKAGSDKPKV